MPVVKSLKDMFEKYNVKYDAESYTAALTAVKPIAVSAYQSASSIIYDAVERTRGILDDEGVPAPLWGIYLSFAQILAKKTYNFSLNTLLKEASALKSEWITAHGADPEILDKIITALIGTVAPY